MEPAATPGMPAATAKPRVTIVGGGAAGLMLGCLLPPESFHVRIYDKSNAPGRKLLVAGQGGFNLTHSEPRAGFLARYRPAHFLDAAFDSFTNDDLRTWLEDRGIRTYVGTSGRVFPVKGIRPIDVLNALLLELKTRNVSLHTRWRWLGFSANDALMFQSPVGEQNVTSDITVLALGGGSWPVTGSDGGWLGAVRARGVKVNALQPSNCACRIAWPDAFIRAHEGKPLKNLRISAGKSSCLGEVVITREGLEGSGIYPLVHELRTMLNDHAAATVTLDLKDSMNKEDVQRALAASSRRTMREKLRAINFDEVRIDLLRTQLNKQQYTDAEAVTAALKALPLQMSGLAPIDEAISTVGGVALEEIDDAFRLRCVPHVFCIGEMLDYDAPTGGYLLQSCFSMAAHVARHLVANNSHDAPKSP